MDLHGIESGFDSEFNGLAECFHHFIDLPQVHLVDKGGGVKVEPAACPVWHTAAYPPV